MNQTSKICAIGYAALLSAGALHAQRPNIVFILCDDHARQAISAYGNPISKLAPTPNIDRLAQEGVRFNNCFVENSLSAPSRACLMTGRYSHQNGQIHLMEGIDTTQVFFPELLQQVGYQTAIYGKWNLRCEPKGFTEWHILDDQGNYWNPDFQDKHDRTFRREEGYVTDLITNHAIDFLDHRDASKPFCLMVHHKAPHRNWMPNLKNLNLYEDTEFPEPATLFDDYATRGVAAQQQKMTISSAMEMIQDLKVIEEYDSTSRASAFSLTSLNNELHRMTPDQRQAWDKFYMPRNAKFLAQNLKGRELTKWKYQNYIRDYMRVVQSVDESVGRIYDYLKAHGLLDNTIIVYTSDQGFWMGEHGWFDKRFMYEESLHTPMIVRYPAAVKHPGTANNDMVQNIDWAPTLLDVAGVKAPAQMEGRSIVPLLQGRKPANWRTSVYYHYYDYPTFHLVRRHDGVRTDRYKLIHFYGKGGFAGADPVMLTPGTAENRVLNALKNADYFPATSPDINYNELYDLQNDPNEVNNVYGKPGYEKITRQLQKELDRYRKQLKVKEY